MTELLQDNENLFVAGALRASRYEALGLDGHMAAIPSLELTVPLLEDFGRVLALDHPSDAGGDVGERGRAYEREFQHGRILFSLRCARA